MRRLKVWLKKSKPTIFTPGSLWSGLTLLILEKDDDIDETLKETHDASDENAFNEFLSEATATDSETNKLLLHSARRI